jgi:Domain of unknown function DUF11
VRASLKFAAVAGCCAVALAVYAATALRFGTTVNVSQTATPTEKAKVVRLSYAHAGLFKKAWVVTYGDGPVGQQNVYARVSFDDGATWAAPVLLSRDAAYAPTGGQAITVNGMLGFTADNDKPSIFGPPVTSGPMVMVAWNSSYCPQDPAATGNAGSYVNPQQGAGDFDQDGTPDRPYHCVWVATSTDPTLVSWNVTQLTNGTRDAINEVLGGSSTGNAFAMAWQEDPDGLQPGEAEGRGDGGSGSVVSGGTNIWYTHAPSLSGTTLRTNIAQLSNNNQRGNGQAGASRPNLQLSGTTAVVAYEETSCEGASGGRCIVYHSFNYSAHDANYSGNVLSDVTKNARRVRFVLQGAQAAGASPLRTLVLWRESNVTTPAAPADIVIRRGLAQPALRPGSTGFLPSDVLADPPQRMTDVAATGGNANAHRAIVRGSFVALGYDVTPDMDGANPEKTSPPTANYNFFIVRSTRDGEVGSWARPQNISRIEYPTLTAVEPRLVPTPGTIVNPLTGKPDPGDTQDTNVLYASYATESNTVVGVSGRVFVTRSTDLGVSFEPYVPVASMLAGQSEAQLRPTPDGKSVLVLWMNEQRPGDPDSKEAMFAIANAVELADLGLSADADWFHAGTTRTATLKVLNHGTGPARDVVVTGTLPQGLVPIGISEPPTCGVTGLTFQCRIPEIAVGETRTISMSVTSATEGVYTVAASVSSEYLDADASDNTANLVLTVAAPLPPVEPTPEPGPTPEPTPEPVPPSPISPAPTPDPSPAGGGGGGGCTTAPAGAPFDPTLLVFVFLAAAVARRPRSMTSAPTPRGRAVAFGGTSVQPMQPSCGR